MHMLLHPAPHKPPDDGCKGRSFTPDPSSARCIDWQKLRLQELLGADQQQQGKVPRTVEVRRGRGGRKHVHGACAGRAAASWEVSVRHCIPPECRTLLKLLMHDTMRCTPLS